MIGHDSVSPFVAGLGGKCPRCGEGALFETFLGLRPSCGVCGLDYSAADAGDGPAVFVIFFVGFVAVAAAFTLRFSWLAPLWLTLLVSVGLTIGLTLLLLRPFKATLIALQYRHKAAEGRLKE